VPTTAQEKVSRAPLAALLILLSLFLSSGTAAAGADFRAPARLGPSRHNIAAAVLPSGSRNPLDDELSGAPADANLPPSRPVIVTERLWARPLTESRFAPWAAIPRPAGAAYRARAPPAS
jgi:hypothetical protein